MGRLGEAIAAVFLERHGLKIIGRNIRIGRGEIDLLADDGGSRVAIEVKTVVGRAGGWEQAEAAFTDEKAATVRRLAATLEPRVRRVDLVAVALTQSGAAVRWLRSAA